MFQTMKNIHNMKWYEISKPSLVQNISVTIGLYVF